MFRCVTILGLCALSCTATFAQDVGDVEFDPSAIEEFAPVSLSKNNDLFLTASTTARVYARLRRTRTKEVGDFTASVVQVNVKGATQSSAVHLDVCSLSSHSGSREVVNSCHVGAVVVQGR